LFALDDPSPNRIGLDLKRAMRTPYKIDDYQQTYFVIDSYEDLLRRTLETDFAPLYAELDAAPDLPVDAVLPEDNVITLGAQAYAEAEPTPPDCRKDFA
jgi:phenylalanine-4-hydroxylase